jgi:predicted outer membrane repeat protein
VLSSDDSFVLLESGELACVIGTSRLFFARVQIITGTEFISNTGGFQGGGAILSNITQVRITGGRFERNVCLNDNGGGVRVVGLVMSGTQFISNTGRNGGGVYALDATIIGGKFQGNRATFGNGGGVFAGAELEITGTQFISNAATTSGGGVSHVPFSGDDARIVNALFARNTAGGSGAALSLGIAGPSSGEAHVLHTTIADTGLNPRQAIVVDGGTVYITNTIIASHTIGISQTGHPAFPPAIFEDYNLFFGVAFTKTGVVTSGGHSPIGNPLFLAPASDNYHLRFDTSASAAIDAGVDAGVTRDVDGDSRPIGGGFDIGYDEWTGVFFRTYLPLVLKN